MPNTCWCNCQIYEDAMANVCYCILHISSVQKLEAPLRPPSILWKFAYPAGLLWMHISWHRQRSVSTLLSCQTQSPGPVVSSLFSSFMLQTSTSTARHDGMTVLASKRSMSNAFCSALHILRWQLEFHGLHVHLAEAQTTVSNFRSTHACRLGKWFQNRRVWYHKLWCHGFIVCVCVCAPKNARFHLLVFP